MKDLEKLYFNESISIIVPLHNKQENIKNTIFSIHEYIKAKKIEILIIENGSTDLSLENARRAKDKLNGKVDIHIHHSKKGLGNALRKGFELAKNKWIYFVPADFSFGNSDISYVVNNNLISKFDFFIGSKGHPESQIIRKFSRKIYSKILNSYINYQFNTKILDTQGSLLFKSKILKTLPALQSEEFMITAEIIILSIKNKINIKEVPITDYQIYSKSTVSPIRDGSKMIYQLYKLKSKLTI